MTRTMTHTIKSGGGWLLQVRQSGRNEAAITVNRVSSGPKLHIPRTGKCTNPRIIHFTFDDIERIFDRFSLRRSRTRGLVRLHTHSYFELVLVTEGNATHHFGGLEYNVQQLDLLAVSPWVPHRYTNHTHGKGFAITLVNFGFDALQDALDDPAVMSMLTLLSLGRLHSPGAPPGLFRPVPGPVHRYLQLLIEEVSSRRDAPGQITIVNSLLHLMLMELYRHRDTSQEIDEDIDVLPILKSLSVIGKMATTRDVSVKDIAAEVGFSPGYFSTRFTQLIGENVLQYVQRVRVLRALQLLATTDLSVDAIAAKVGYRDVATFRSVFRAVTGYTPSLYRKYRPAKA